MMLSASLWRMTSTPTWQDEIEKPYGRLAAGSNQLLIKTRIALVAGLYQSAPRLAPVPPGEAQAKWGAKAESRAS